MNRTRRFKKFGLPVLFSCLLASGAEGQTSTLVYPGAGGKLEYKPYANQGQANAVNAIPDFSYAGYKGGGVPLPNVRVAETVNPRSGAPRGLLHIRKTQL